MASITRRKVAEVVHRKTDDLGGGLKYTQLGDDQPEGDYTDAIDAALRTCRFATIADADTDDKISAVLTGAEYYIMQRLLNKWISRPTVQQGAGASGLHLMVQTESTIASLRMSVKGLRQELSDALARIGVSIDRADSILAGTVEIDHENEVTQDLVDGSHALPWFEESYWPTS